MADIAGTILSDEGFLERIYITIAVFPSLSAYVEHRVKEAVPACILALYSALPSSPPACSLLGPNLYTQATSLPPASSSSVKRESLQVSGQPIRLLRFILANPDIPHSRGETAVSSGTRA